MKNKKLFYLLGVILILVILVICYISNKKEDILTTDMIDIDINTDNGDEKIDWSEYEEKDYTLTESITITEGGIYNLTGKIEYGNISIDTEDNVKLVLNDVNITNSKGPAIYVKNASDVVIELKEDSNNFLEDASSYVGYKDNEVGTIFSHDDITFQGNGTLTIISNNEDAIVSKDDLKIVSGTYNITSKDDAIRGKDSVYIKEGIFNINSGGDGIKSTNEEDDDKGFVLIENGKFNITASEDGISASKRLLIEDGVFNITTGGGSSNASTKDTWGRWGNSYYTSSTSSASAKGIKSGDNLVIENGTFTLDTSDDAIHCNSYIGIKNGTFNISSGDDGIHADTKLIIDNGTIDITKSYEGIESAGITINNGNIKIVSTDDGINVAGGNDSSSRERPGANNYTTSSKYILTINGGNIYVNADGDGIDVNGSAYIYGGTIKVDGPEDNGNGALDYDNTFEVNGGILLAGGSSGMLQSISSDSSQYNVTIVFTSSYSNDDVITIEDASGNEIVEYTSNKKYNSLVVSSPEFKDGEAYTIEINNEEYKTFTISSITTNIGNTMMGGNMPGGNKPDNGRPDNNKPDRR